MRWEGIKQVRSDSTRCSYSSDIRSDSLSHTSYDRETNYEDDFMKCMIKPDKWDIEITTHVKPWNIIWCISRYGGLHHLNKNQVMVDFKVLRLRSQYWSGQSRQGSFIL